MMLARSSPLATQDVPLAIAGCLDLRFGCGVKLEDLGADQKAGLA